MVGSPARALTRAGEYDSLRTSIRMCWIPAGSTVTAESLAAGISPLAMSMVSMVSRPRTPSQARSKVNDEPERTRRVDGQQPGHNHRHRRGFAQVAAEKVPGSADGVAEDGEEGAGPDDKDGHSGGPDYWGAGGDGEDHDRQRHAAGDEDGQEADDGGGQDRLGGGAPTDDTGEGGRWRRDQAAEGAHAEKVGGHEDHDDASGDLHGSPGAEAELDGVPDESEEGAGQGVGDELAGQEPPSGTTSSRRLRFGPWASWRRATAPARSPSLDDGTGGAAREQPGDEHAPEVHWPGLPASGPKQSDDVMNKRPPRRIGATRIIRSRRVSVQPKKGGAVRPVGRPFEELGEEGEPQCALAGVESRLEQLREKNGRSGGQGRQAHQRQQHPGAAVVARGHIPHAHQDGQARHEAMITSAMKSIRLTGRRWN